MAVGNPRMIVWMMISSRRRREPAFSAALANDSQLGLAPPRCLEHGDVAISGAPGGRRRL